jgi:hypothetical protein
MIRRMWGNVGQITGLMALFIVLGGPAWAADAINGARIKASTITGKQVKNKSLTGADVKDGSLTSADVKDGSIRAADLAPGTIPAPAAAATTTPTSAAPAPAPVLTIPDGSITTAKFAASAIAPLARALPGLRTEPGALPNVIGGAEANAVGAGAKGATIGGGSGQSVTADDGTVAGGKGNTVSAAGATVGGGTSNTASGAGATVGGGQGNTASGASATVGGGASNTASGAFSVAFGRRAKAVNAGSFVFADSTNADFSSTADDQVSFRAANGVVIANDAGNAAAVPVGTRYRDNSVVAWGRITATGGLDTNFNVASVTHVGTGVYNVVLASPMQSGFSLIPTVSPEIDAPSPGAPPTGASAVRIAATDQVAAGTNFSVYVYNGSYALVDNDFQFVVTGR